MLLRICSGNPLSNETIDEIVQSPRMAAPTPLCAQRLPSPNGSSMIGEIAILCGTSSSPMRVLGVEVVGVLRLGRRAREEVRLAELVVLEPAVRVVDAAAPAVADPLLELEDRGVVLAAAGGVLAHEDVVELRERTQQLTSLNRRAGHALALSGGQAEERVRHLIVQGRPERQMLRRHLVDVDDAVVRATEAEVPAGRADVFEADGHVAAKLARDVNRVLMMYGAVLS